MDPSGHSAEIRWILIEKRKREEKRGLTKESLTDCVVAYSSHYPISTDSLGVHSPTFS